MRIMGLVLLMFSTPLWALEFASTTQRTTVVELYTSEGCSSCPPADRWVSSLRDDPRIFNSLLPLVFHVDYWDRLGWKDPYASKAYSQRQYALVQEDILSQAYTPGIVVDSQEWRQWFRGQRQLKTTGQSANILSVTLQDNLLTAEYDADAIFIFNVAYLGMGLKTNVLAGENRGRQLQHDFVVLSHQQQSGEQRWQLQLTDLPDKGQQQTALAVWLTPLDSLQIIQAAGSLLEAD